MNVIDIILTVILVAVVVLVIFVMRRSSKSGKGGCSCGCQSCGHPCESYQRDTTTEDTDTATTTEQ